MKTAFIIAFEFPPLNTGGTQRIIKFIKYLADFNVRPVVFTLDPNAYSNVFEQHYSDPNTLVDLPAECEIVNVPCRYIRTDGMGRLRRFLSTYFSIYSREAAGWHKHITSAVRKQIEILTPQALIVTAPPFSMIALGVMLSKRFNVPLILDMRDSWTGWRAAPYGSIIHYWLTVLYERTFFKHAEYVVFTSDQAMIDAMNLHPNLPTNKFELIPNGYDKDITDWTITTKTNSDKFIIGYVGTFYYSASARDTMFTPRWKKRGHRILQYVSKHEDWLYQTPYFFFQALIRMRERSPEIFRKVIVRFVGDCPEWLLDMCGEFGLDNHVDFLGLMPLRDSLLFQKSCDALLVTSSKTIDGDSYAIPGKTYEYISAKKPIIGFVSRGALKRLLERSGLAVVCDPDSPDESATKLEELITRTWKSTPNSLFLEQLHRKRLTKKLANLIHNIR